MIDDLCATVEAAKKRITDLRERSQEQDDALRGMVGLIQLVLGRNDLTRELRHVLTTNHRIEAAQVAILKAERAPL